MRIESELKYAVGDPSLFGEIVALEDLAGYRVLDRGILPITDTAFDTPDRSLYRGAAVFRLRETPEHRVLTFKASRPRHGAAHERIEVESPVTVTPDDIAAGRLPDVPATLAFRERFGDVPLTPSLVTRNDRRILFLHAGDTPVYELVLDTVTFIGPRGEAHVYEVEVESLIGPDNELDRIDRWLRERFGLEPAGPSKYLLGMKLVGTVPGET